MALRATRHAGRTATTASAISAVNSTSSAGGSGCAPRSRSQRSAAPSIDTARQRSRPGHARRRAYDIRPGRRTFLWVSGLVLLGVLLFHRSFMFYYVDIPATALLLAAFGEPGPAVRSPAAP